MFLLLTGEIIKIYIGKLYLKIFFKKLYCLNGMANHG